MPLIALYEMFGAYKQEIPSHQKPCGGFHRPMKAHHTIPTWWSECYRCESINRVMPDMRSFSDERRIDLGGNLPLLEDSLSLFYTHTIGRRRNKNEASMRAGLDAEEARPCAATIKSTGPLDAGADSRRCYAPTRPAKRRASALPLFISIPADPPSVARFIM